MFCLGSVLLLLLFMYQFVAQAADSIESGITPRKELDADGPKRTMVTIVWGCVSTTLICAWAAIHPNIQPREGPFKAILRRLELLMIATVAPELLPAFALNQLFAALEIRNTYNERLDGYKRRGFWESVKAWFSWKDILQMVKGWFSLYEIKRDGSCREWTVAHGFFVIMGGIHLMEPVERNAVSLEAEKDRVRDMEIGLSCDQPEATPTILTMEMLKVLDKLEINVTEDEIADRAKGDTLSKTILVLQSSWFIVQCITRAVQGLAMTQLELTTLALASLNGITFFLWWKKPLGGKIAVRVYLKRKLTDEEKTLQLRKDPPKKSKDWRGSHRLYIFSNLHTVFSAAMAVIRDPHADNPHADDVVKKWFLNLHWAIRLPLAVATLLLFPIIALVMYCVYTLGDVMLNGSSCFPVETRHVPTFYSPRVPSTENWHRFIVMILATGFGATHCAGWNFIFPTYSEEKLWRLASLGVTMIPSLLFILFFIVKIPVGILVEFFHLEKTMERNILAVVSPLFAFAYVAARLVILAQGVALLRHQPPSAFTAVDWSKFYPHFF